MPIHELAALAAAFCWAVTGLLSKDAAEALGPFGFNRVRGAIVVATLLVIIVATGRWHGVTGDALLRLSLSGVIGIFIGDTILYVALVQLGPRRAGALFALNAPMAAVLGWAVLGEALSIRAILGIALTTGGVALAVLGRAGRSGTHRFEAVRGSIWVAVGMGLGSALGQAVGSLIARPVMETGFDPYIASMIRSAVALVGISALMLLPIPAIRQKNPLTLKILIQTAFSGWIAMVGGMTLLMFALQGGKVGIVSTLSALSPVLILPALWAVTGQRPSAASWLGALAAVLGMALIFL